MTLTLMKCACGYTNIVTSRPDEASAHPAVTMGCKRCGEQPRAVPEGRHLRAV